MGIQSISRELKSRITFPSLTLDDFYIQEFEYSGSLLTKDEFEIGTAPAIRLKIKLKDDTGALKSYNFENKECNAEIGIVVDDVENFHSLGLFTVEKAVRVKDTITLECIDRMYKAEVPYVDNLTYPATVLQVFQRACSIAGLGIASTVFANADYAIPYLPVYENVSVRKILASVAELAGGYAIINKLGQIEIITLEKAIASADINKDTYISLKFDEVAPAYIDKVVVKVGDEESTAGTGNHPYTVLNNILVQTPSNVVNAIYDVLNGLNYSPVQVKWQGDWSLNLGDRVSIDDDEVIRYSYLFDRKITYRGGIREEFKAPNKSDLIKNSTGKGSLTLDVNQVKTEIKIISGEIDQVISDTEGNFTQINQDIDSISNRVGTAEGDINSLELTATGLTNRISNAEGNVSTLQNTAAGLTNRVSNAEGNISTLQNTAQGLALDVAAADGRALNAQATADAVTLNFNNLKIGGVNLVRNGSLEYETSGWTAWSNTTISKTSDGIIVAAPDNGTYSIGVCSPGFRLKNGQEYTLSFDAASFYGTSALDYIWLLDTTSGNVRLPDISIVGYDTSYRRYKLSFTSAVSGDNVKVLIGRQDASGNITGFILKNVQLEEGNRETPFKNAENEIFAASHIFDRNGYTIKDSNGVELMSLSKGVANEQNIGRVDNVEVGYPMKIPFHIGSEVSQITQAVLKWDMSNFRTYSKGAASGGGVRTTPSGGGSTSGPSSRSTADNSGPATFVSNTQTELSYPNEGKHYHRITAEQMTHSHGMAHTHTTPSHSHSLDITHEHAPVFGILETGITVDYIVGIYVDGVYRAMVNATRGEIDLSAWITTNGWHELMLYVNGIKRLDANLFLKTYIRR